MRLQRGESDFPAHRLGWWGRGKVFLRQTEGFSVELAAVVVALSPHLFRPR